MKKTILLTLGLVLATAQSWGDTHPATIVNQLLTSAKVDLQHDSATLPLHLGHLRDGRSVYFVLTDSSDPATAAKYGLVIATKLASLANLKSTRTATIDSAGNFTFDKGTVDFSPKRVIVPGDAPNYFPPKSFMPGSVGDADYSPFVKIAGTNIVLNAPIVAFDVSPQQIAFCNGNVDYDLVHDRVTSICPEKMQVSLSLGHGFADSEKVIYLSLDSNNALPATMEDVTYTPATQDQLNAHADEALYAFANGATGVNNPNRQGFNSALAGEGSPLNILDGLTVSSRGYTPLWNVNVAVWTDSAIKSGARRLLTSGDDVEMANEAKLLTNPMGGEVQSLGLLVNCPVIGFLE